MKRLLFGGICLFAVTGCASLPNQVAAALYYNAAEDACGDDWQCEREVERRKDAWQDEQHRQRRAEDREQDSDY